MSSQYYQKKRVSFNIDPVAFSELQRLRSLYLLSGKTLVEIPTITEFVNGILYFTYAHLMNDYNRMKSGDHNLLMFPYIKGYYDGMAVERELDREEYEDFVASLPPDTLKLEVEEIREYGELIYKNPAEYNRLATYEPQGINMILDEDKVILVRKINRILNDIYSNHALYSLSDIVKSTITAVMLTDLSSIYVDDVYVAHLYGIDPKDYLEFYYETYYGSLRFDDPKYRHFLSVLADKPLVDELHKISSKFNNITANMSNLTMKKNRKMLDGLFEDIDNELHEDRLWSYVTNFNYKKALKGIRYIDFAIDAGLGISDLVGMLYKGVYGGKSYRLFIHRLVRFMDAVFMYSTGGEEKKENTRNL